MYKFCKQIVKLDNVPAIVNKNLHSDLEFKKSFDLNTKLIMLNEKVQSQENFKDISISLIGGLFISLGIYGIYEVYFSKSEAQIMKLKLSLQCYCKCIKSFYQNDLKYIVNYLNDMKKYGLRNTGFMIFILEGLSITKQNYHELLQIYQEIGTILLSNEIYQKMYGIKFAKTCSKLIDYGIFHQLELPKEIIIPALINYLHSQSVLVSIQALYILTLHQIDQKQYIQLLKTKMKSEYLENYTESTELFDILKKQNTEENYEKFEQIYRESLESQRQKLLHQVIIKQKIQL